MTQKIVSPAPHIHTAKTTSVLMRDVLIALSPAVLVSILFFGWAALKLLVVSVVACILTEWLIERFIMKSPVTICDYSAAVTGVLLALNLPASIPWWIIIIGAIVAIGVGKMTFGGLGQNIFNPALLARVFLLISFPVAMTDWTMPASWFPFIDATSGATPLGVVSEGLTSGLTLSQIFEAQNLTPSQMLFVNMGGSAGELSSIALLLGFIYLLVRKVIKPHITLSILITVVVMAGIFHLCDPERFTGIVFNLFSGGLLLGAIFMATDYVTSPMNTKGMIIFGVGIGMITMLIRYFGSYPEGVSFAILIMNCTVPLLNKLKPARFGK